VWRGATATFFRVGGRSAQAVGKEGGQVGAERLVGHTHAMTTVNGKPTMFAQAPQQASVTVGVPTNVQQSVQQSGIALPGQSPADAAKQLLGNLNGQGFQAPASASKDFGAQLSAALRQFQAAQGLPQTGKIDGATADALKNLGLAGAPADPKAGEKASKDNFERGGLGLLKQGEKGRAEIAKNSTPDTNFLDALLNKLGGEHGVTSDKAGQVGGSAETAANMSKAEGAGDVKKAQTEAEKGKTEAKKTSKDDVQNQAEKIARDSKLQVARGLKAETTKTDEQRRKNALNGADPTERGILDEEAEEDATEGQGGEGKKRGRGGDQDGGGHDAMGTDSAGGVGEKDGDERSKGNAHSGDEDNGDAARGHAVTDDGSGADVGHYQIKSVSEQVFAALDKIQRDQSAANKATTYSWDVTFYKPGIYGPGQKATELVHFVVKEATAFDPVWQKAQTNLQAMIRRIERDAPVPTLDDIVGALRQARARDGDKDADKVTFRRPMGRA